MKKHKFRQETEAVRGGTSLAKKNGPLSTPIYQTSTFEVTDTQEQVRATSTDSFYTRYGNPTHTVAENAIAELEGTDAALLFSSGMAAITTSILALHPDGQRLDPAQQQKRRVRIHRATKCRTHMMNLVDQIAASGRDAADQVGMSA
ncbi:MAG TPA: PLP-dependent transferase, partial [Terriglobales bacterium]|nr:PLP-dependent transferase [Terriglobales bacterium]